MYCYYQNITVITIYLNIIVIHGDVFLSTETVENERLSLVIGPEQRQRIEKLVENTKKTTGFDVSMSNIARKALEIGLKEMECEV